MHRKVSLFSQASASIAVPLWQVVLLRIGKKATLFIGLSVTNQFLQPRDKNDFPPLASPSYLCGLFMSPAALHPCCDYSRLRSQQPASLHDYVHSDGIQRGDHILATLVSQFSARTQSSQSSPRPLSHPIRIKTECT